jgi:hypothetical protein
MKYSGSVIGWFLGFVDFEFAEKSEECIDSRVRWFFGPAIVAEAVLRRKAAAVVMKAILVNMVVSPVFAAHTFLACARRR